MEERQVGEGHIRQWLPCQSKNIAFILGQWEATGRFEEWPDLIHILISLGLWKKNGL